MSTCLHIYIFSGAFIHPYTTTCSSFLHFYNSTSLHFLHVYMSAGLLFYITTYFTVLHHEHLHVCIHTFYDCTYHHSTFSGLRWFTCYPCAPRSLLVGLTPPEDIQAPLAQVTLHSSAVMTAGPFVFMRGDASAFSPIR